MIKGKNKWKEGHITVKHSNGTLLKLVQMKCKNRNGRYGTVIDWELCKRKKDKNMNKNLFLKNV